MITWAVFQILERRKKRDAQLAEKHRLEMEEEMTRQQQQRDKLNDEISRKVENSELKKNVKVVLTFYLWTKPMVICCRCL